WAYLYRAVDKEGRTIDYFLSAKRDKKSARSFFEKVFGNNGRPEKINRDKSGPNIFALEVIMKKTKVQLHRQK
ncbi:MAG: DDE-type integrase/transposase/recombinase, partial [Nitrospinota bacterium]